MQAPEEGQSGSVGDMAMVLRDEGKGKGGMTGLAPLDVEVDVQVKLEMHPLLCWARKGFREELLLHE